jgi:hypothetical protein
MNRTPSLDRRSIEITTPQVHIETTTILLQSRGSPWTTGKWPKRCPTTAVTGVALGFAGGALGGGETRGRGEAVVAGAWKESLLEERNAEFYHKYSYSIYKIFRNIF